MWRTRKTQQEHRVSYFCRLVARTFWDVIISLCLIIVSWNFGKPFALSKKIKLVYLFLWDLSNYVLYWLSICPFGGRRMLEILSNYLYCCTSFVIENLSLHLFGLWCRNFFCTSLITLQRAEKPFWRNFFFFWSTKDFLSVTVYIVLSP